MRTSLHSVHAASRRFSKLSLKSESLMPSSSEECCGAVWPSSLLRGKGRRIVASVAFVVCTRLLMRTSLHSVHTASRRFSKLSVKSESLMQSSSEECCGAVWPSSLLRGKGRRIVASVAFVVCTRLLMRTSLHSVHAASRRFSELSVKSESLMQSTPDECSGGVAFCTSWRKR